MSCIERCPHFRSLVQRCPYFRVSFKRGSTVYSCHLVYCNRHSTHPQDGPASPSYMSYSRQLPERKRTNPTPAASQALKRTRVARPSSTVTSSTSSIHKENLFNRLRVPDIEYESDGESTGGVGPDDSEPKSVENGDAESVASGRSNTPILPEEDEDAEIKKKVILAVPLS